MRVNDTMLQKNFLANLAFSSERLYDKETRVLTNKAINKPSDNPIDALNSLAIRERLDEIVQYQRNITRTKTLLQNTETVVYQMSDLFTRVKELAVQGASDSYGVSDKLSVSYEINQLLEQVLIASNNRSESTYTFGGTYNNIPPYAAVRDENGEIVQVTTTGSSGDINRVLGENVSIKANINGEELFEQGGNIFDVLIKLRDDLRTGDSDLVRQDIISIDWASEKINNVMAIIGSRTNRVNAAGERAESDKINFTEFLSNTEDIDASEAIMDYQMELLTLQSSLQAGARLLHPRLGDFLG